MKICGQHITAEFIAQVQALIASEPELSRQQLSRRVCEVMGWHSPNGMPKETSCRVALLKLHRQGRIELPKAVSHPNLRRTWSAIAVDDSFVDAPPVECTLEQLGWIRVVRIQRGDRDASRRWNTMMQRYHYLGAGPLCGAQMRYFIESEHYGILGGLAFSAAAWRVSVRDRWIGWDDAIREQRLPGVINNSRFLILPVVKVKNLASHVLSLAAKQLMEDWPIQYGIEPVLLETFVEHGRFTGASYKAANWLHLGQTQGRGRQDRHTQYLAPVKDVYVYRLRDNAVAVLREGSRGCPRPAPATDWAEEEFGSAQIGDQRRVKRLLIIARDFYAHPQANIPQACGTRSKTKAAYRFFEDERHTMESLLTPHYEATGQRCGQEKIVLAVQDTSSLNYSTHPATENLGPISTSKEGVIGLLVHDTMAFNEAGTPLGLVDVQCWARDPNDFGKKHRRRELPIEQKESYKWLKSYQAVAALQVKYPDTMFVSVGDREADIFELFAMALANPASPRLLVRASHDRFLKGGNERLWEHVERQSASGIQEVHVPRQGKRKARIAEMEIRFCRVELKPPSWKAALEPVKVWSVLAEEINYPGDVKEPLKWMLLTTIEVTTFEQAVQKIAWYTGRWGIEVYHRTLKTGCKIEERQLGSADSIDACLAIDMVVAWRIYHLTKLGRDVPDVPCTVYFEDADWKALVAYKTQNPVPPANPPTLREAVHLLASLGGFLGRKGDGEPGTQTLWLGLQRLDDMAAMWKIMFPHTGNKNKSSPRVQYSEYG